MPYRLDLLVHHSLKISTPGKYIVETVRDVHHDPYYGSPLDLSGHRFFGYRYEPVYLTHNLLKRQFALL